MYFEKPRAVTLNSWSKHFEGTWIGGRGVWICMHDHSDCLQGRFGRVVKRKLQSVLWKNVIVMLWFYLYSVGSWVLFIHATSYTKTYAGTPDKSLTNLVFKNANHKAHTQNFCIIPTTGLSCNASLPPDIKIQRAKAFLSLRNNKRIAIVLDNKIHLSKISWKSLQSVISKKIVFIPSVCINVHHLLHPSGQTLGIDRMCAGRVETLSFLSSSFKHDGHLKHFLPSHTNTWLYARETSKFT